MTEILVYQLLVAALFGVIIGIAMGVYLGSVIARWHHVQAMEQLADITTSLQDAATDSTEPFGPSRMRVSQKRYR